jgi:hypothetical protein
MDNWVVIFLYVSQTEALIAAGKMAQVDAVALGQAYNDVRNDHTSTEW